MENDDVVLGEVWFQSIGYYQYRNTIHKYEYLYVLPRNGIIIGEHGHGKLVYGGQQIRKIKEWYIFSNGDMNLCRKGKTHSLVHHGDPMYHLFKDLEA